MQVTELSQSINVTVPKPISTGSGSAPAQLTYLRLRRILDVLLASIAFLVSLPILVLLCCAIVFESRGMPIFTQRRIGAGGRTFKLYKLRTMYVNSETASFVTREGDARVTRIGSWLRATKIDELPQLINIFLGDMTIIGPRPLSENESNFIRNQMLGVDHPGFIPVHAPGLIGLEQINRRRGISYEERFELNALYEQQICWQLDLQILVRSILQCKAVVYCIVLACICEIVSFLAWGH